MRRRAVGPESPARFTCGDATAGTWELLLRGLKRRADWTLNE
jgi:hypothetical protein